MKIPVGLARWIGQSGEILAWQGVSKIISVVAFAYAAKALGPEKFGISGIVMSIAMQIIAFSSLVNEAGLSRRFRRARSSASRQRLINAAAAGRFVLAVGLLIPAVGVGLFLAPTPQWWLPIFAAVPLVLAIFFQPSWILIGQDRSHVVWRTIALGSLVTSGLLFVLPNVSLRAGTDVIAVSVGGIATTVTAWWLALGPTEYRISLSPRYLKYTVGLVRQGFWLFIIYLAGNAYLYLDVFILGVMGSSTDAGLYRPAANLAASFHQSVSFIPLLLFPRLLDWAKDRAKLRRRQIQIASWLLVWAGAVILTTALVAKPVFFWLYGSTYLAASGPFVVLIAARSLGIVASVFTWGLIARDSDRAVGLIFVVGASVALAGSVILIPRIGLWGSAWGALACDGVIFTLATWLSLRRSAEHPKAA